MGKFVRYGLAAVCFAASVGCLALWERGISHSDLFLGPSRGQLQPVLYFGNAYGSASVGYMSWSQAWPDGAWSHIELPLTDEDKVFRDMTRQRFGNFRLSPKYDDVTFPIWYPALVFALAGVGVLRFRWQFSTRSALITVGVIAVLLGIVVSL